MKTYEIFDTNCLLEYYRSGNYERESLYSLFDKYVENDIFIPYQVIKELKRNKDFHKRQHEKFKHDTAEAKSRMSNILNEMYSKKFYSGKFKERCISFDNKVKKDLRKVIQFHKNLVDELYSELEHKDILDLVEHNFSNGSRFSTEEYLNVLSEFHVREINKLPPGVTDLKKKDNKHGDFFIWKEILKFAKNKENCKIIFITAEKKSDWWDIERDTRKMSSFLENEFKEKNPLVQIEFEYFFDYLKDKRHNHPELKIQSIIDQMSIKDALSENEDIISDSILEYFVDKYNISDESSCFIEYPYFNHSFNHISDEEIEFIFDVCTQVNNYDDYERYSVSDVTIKSTWKKEEGELILLSSEVLNVILGDNYMEPSECMRCSGENYTDGDFCSYCKDFIDRQ